MSLGNFFIPQNTKTESISAPDSTDLILNSPANVQINCPNGFIENNGIVTFFNPGVVIPYSSNLFFFYFEGLLSVTFSGSVLAMDTTISNIGYIKIGSQITLSFPAMSFAKGGGAPSSLVANAAIPDDILPGNNYSAIFSAQDGGAIISPTNLYGLIKVDAGGDIVLQKGYNQSWESSVSNILTNPFQITYFAF